jgi:SSS family solute:Na+ symporter
MVRLFFTVFARHFTDATTFYHKIFINTNWLHYEVVNFFICVAVIIVISLLTKQVPKERILGLTFGSSTKEQRAESRASWNKWDIVHSLVILSVIIAFYAYFWK